MSVLGGVFTYTPFWIFQPLAPAGFRKCQPVRSLPLNREIQFGFFAEADWPRVISKQVSAMIRKVLTLSPLDYQVKSAKCKPRFLPSPRLLVLPALSARRRSLDCFECDALLLAISDMAMSAAMPINNQSPPKCSVPFANQRNPR